MNPLADSKTTTQKRYRFNIYEMFFRTPDTAISKIF